MVYTVGGIINRLTDVRKTRILILGLMVCSNGHGNVVPSRSVASPSFVSDKDLALQDDHDKTTGSEHFLTVQMMQEDRTLPMVIETQQGVFDERRQQISLSHPTTLWQGRGLLQANQCWYDLKQGRIKATGDIRLRHEDGAIAQCDTLDVALKQKKGSATNIHVLSPQRHRLSARSMRQNPDETVWTWGSFTPCAVCKVKDFPLWSLHAQRMTWKPKKRRWYCQKATLAVRGKPVFKIPSISFATQRASGLLLPRVGQAQPLGWFAGMPYFWALSPEHDVTVTPFVTTKAGVLVAGHYRGHTAFHRTSVQGAYNLSPASIQASSLSRPLFVQEELPSSRGYFRGETLCRLHDTVRLSADQWWVSDDSFLASRPLFGHAQDTYLPSHVTLEQLTPWSYARVRDLRYRSLQSDGAQKTTTSYVSPEIAYSVFMPLTDLKNDQFTSRVHAIGWSKWDDRCMKRLVYDNQWTYGIKGGWGLEHEVDVRMIGTAYQMTSPDPIGVRAGMGTETETETETDMRRGAGMGQALDEVQAPKALYSSLGWTSRWLWMMPQGGMLVPVVQGIVSPGLARSQGLPPNHDSQCLMFDETNLFQGQRFCGYDRLDDHSRVNGGIEWMYASQHGYDMRAIVGQSYAFEPPNEDLHPVGIRYGASDIIAAIHCHWDGFDGLYRVRINPLTHRFSLQEMAWKTGPSWAELSGSYVFNRYEDHPLKGAEIRLPEIHQYTTQLSTHITDQWRASVFATYDLGGEDASRVLQTPQWRDVGCELSFENECISTHVTLQKSFYSFQEMRPGWTLSLSVQLQSLSSKNPIARRFAHDIFDTKPIHGSSFITPLP